MKWLLLLLLALSLEAIEVRKLLDEKAYFKLLQELEMLKTYEDISEFPMSAKKGDLVILTNDYHLRKLWEYDGEAWNSWEEETLNLLLNKPQTLITASTPSASKTKPKILLTHLHAATLTALEDQLNTHLTQHALKKEQIVSLQILPESGGFSAILAYWP